MRGLTTHSDRHWQRACAEADDVVKPVTHKLNRVAPVRCSALARICVNSLCILLQELYLTRCLDGNSLDCSNLLNRCRRALALCNEICSQQCACPAKTSLAMNGNWSANLALPCDEGNELLGLLNRRCATIGDWQTKKREASRLVN